MTFPETIFEILRAFNIDPAYLSPLFSSILKIIKSWWWVLLPFLFWKPFLFLWRWWRVELWLKKIKMIIIEVKIPRDVLKPLRAMEQVFASLWSIYDPPNWKERWIEGKTLLSFSLEIVGIGGEGPHFFIRFPEIYRNLFESAIYSQYPEAEISLVDDYTKYVPQDIPNKDWDFFGGDFVPIMEDVYPIKTYPKFFEERPETAEEKRLDPLATLLEGMAKLKAGEQIWVQIIISPITSRENDYVGRGKKIVAKIIKRPEKPKPKSPIELMAEALISGKPVEIPKEEVKEIIPPEMRLTPGEREIVSAIEAKIAKQVFLTNIRYIYLAKRDVFFKPQIRIVTGFFNQFSTTNLNALKHWGATLTKIHYIMIKRRTFLRQRMLFRRYIRRFTPLFPRAGGTFVLDTEELATIFHFPARVAVPSAIIPRVEAKKGEPPPGLPVE